MTRFISHHAERGDEEDLADRCRFDRSTRGSVIRIDERDCAFGDRKRSHVTSRASTIAHSCLLRLSIYKCLPDENFLVSTIKLGHQAKNRNGVSPETSLDLDGLGRR